MKKGLLMLMLAAMTLPALSLTSLTVVSPNGGENWIMGCPYAIQWLSSNTTGTVKIELFKNDVFYLTISSQVPATMSTYTWTPPAGIAAGNTFKVKITSLTSAASFDFSDGYFSIAQGSITVVSPNGGEAWQIGSTHQLLWTDNICDNVRIELWKGGVFNTLITASTPSNGSFTWAIPATLAAGNDYKLKVMSVSTVAGTTSQVFDFSDNNFTIAQGNFIIVTSPNGGESWARGSTHIITWIDNIPWNVRIELWKGGSFNSLINASTPSTGSCYWAIPFTLSTGSDYKVKILAVSNSGTVPLFDFSDNNFTITGPSPTATPFGLVKIYPNPGSSLLHLQFAGASESPVEIKILDFSGAMAVHLLKQDVNENELIDMDTSGLRDGSYLVIVLRDKQVVSRNNLVIRH